MHQVLWHVCTFQYLYLWPETWLCKLENRMKLRARRNSPAKAQQPRSWSLSERKARPPRLASNIAFAKALGAELTKTVAMKLSLVSRVNSFEKMARTIQLQFVCNAIEIIADTSYPDAYQQLENTRLGNGSQHQRSKDKAAPIDPLAFTQRMEALQLPTTAIYCPAATNLTWLSEALRLTAVEQKVLEYAYSLASRVECVQPLVLRDLRYKTMALALQHLAIILDTPGTEVAQCYSGPSRLYGLQLLSQERTGHFTTLDELLNMPPFTVQLLETPFKASSNLLVAMMQPAFYADTLPDASVSRTLLELWMPMTVADAYDAVAHHQPLTAVHIAALLQWFTRCELNTKAFSSLAGKLDFEKIISATQRYCFEQSTAGKPLTTPELLDALHLAANNS
jgi:hypothetical protein